MNRPVPFEGLAIQAAENCDSNPEDVYYCVVYGGNLCPVIPGSSSDSLKVWNDEIKKYVIYKPKGEVAIWVGTPYNLTKEEFLSKFPNRPTPKKSPVKRGGSTKKAPIKREL